MCPMRCKWQLMGRWSGSWRRRTRRPGSWWRATGRRWTGALCTLRCAALGMLRMLQGACCARRAAWAAGRAAGFLELACVSERHVLEMSGCGWGAQAGGCVNLGEVCVYHDFAGRQACCTTRTPPTHPPARASLQAGGGPCWSATLLVGRSRSPHPLAPTHSPSAPGHCSLQAGGGPVGAQHRERGGAAGAGGKVCRPGGRGPAGRGGWGLPVDRGGSEERSCERYWHSMQTQEDVARRGTEAGAFCRGMDMWVVRGSKLATGKRGKHGLTQRLQQQAVAWRCGALWVLSRRGMWGAVCAYCACRYAQRGWADLPLRAVPPFLHMSGHLICKCAAVGSH